MLFRSLLLAILLFPVAARAQTPAMQEPPAFADESPIYTTVVLQGLDKISARVQKIEVPVNGTVQFGSLLITARTCKKSKPLDPPESAAFLEIDEAHLNEPKKLVFSGWMFASSPALSALEHPVYDLGVLDCK